MQSRLGIAHATSVVQVPVLMKLGVITRELAGGRVTQEGHYGKVADGSEFEPVDDASQGLIARHDRSTGV